ncbi:MAG: glycoside hydrolase family 127 protein [Armatimonadetes bacterium]|nr:glycoside hydrolase family 127 protein [Armatimonadota bacterium]
MSAVTRRLSPVPFTAVSITDSFWAPRLATNRDVTLPAEYAQLQQTGRIDAFDLSWKPGMEPVPHYFWDSDVAKWIEAASYSLATHPDPELDTLLDEVIAKIAGAQQPDGYLNVYFTVVAPEQRWANLHVHHELYCAGHLMEAAVAHHQATGKRTLLDVMTRYADYIDSVFGEGPGHRSGTCGHEEIELALVKLYHATSEERYLRLSEFFLNQRGQKPSVFAHEFAPGESFDTSYCQDHLPVREQSEVTGHAVRAMYLYSGMADVAGETGDEGLLRACQRLWDHLTLKNMYLTGGIGSTRHNEGFTRDYDLPNDTAYCETCAAIGLVFWAHRMLQLTADSRYADVMERALYNGTISGVSLDGKRFFYENPLESAGHHHRQDWFGCACCPPNIARLLASLGGYVYSLGDDGVFVHLYVQGEGRLRVAGQDATLRQQTDYPWDGAVRLTLGLAEPATFALNLRLPDWCAGATLTVDGEPVDIAANSRQGYLHLDRTWTGDEVIELTLPMPVQRVYAHPAVRADAGLVALQRGPVVYCLEAADNPWPLHRVVLPRDATCSVRYAPDLLGGVTVIEAEGLVEVPGDWEGKLYSATPDTLQPARLTAIPYCTWDNREPGAMRVWLRET